MYNLYIDFDGVILDTIEETRIMMENSGVDLNNEEEVRVFYKELDWNYLLENTKEINNSLECINKIIDTNLFDVSILTHVNSINEIIEKIKYIRKYFNDITIIPVPIEVSKTKMVHTDGSILIDDRISNLVEWNNEGGISVLFTKEKTNTKYINISSLDEIIEIFKN